MALALSACGAAPRRHHRRLPPADSRRPPATAAPTAAPTASAPPAATGITITDVAGRTVTIAGTPERLISLAPSDTEILFALDLAPRVRRRRRFLGLSGRGKEACPRSAALADLQHRADRRAQARPDPGRRHHAARDDQEARRSQAAVVVMWAAQDQLRQYLRRHYAGGPGHRPDRAGHAGDQR